MLQFKVEQKKIKMSVGEKNNVSMNVDSAVTVDVAGRKYDGSYEITPTVNGQTINTKEKYMVEDLTVLAIPVCNVTNNSGGTTFYIADACPVA